MHHHFPGGKNSNASNRNATQQSGFLLCCSQHDSCVTAAATSLGATSEERQLLSAPAITISLPYSNWLQWQKLLHFSLISEAVTLCLSTSVLSQRDQTILDKTGDIRLMAGCTRVKGTQHTSYLDHSR